MKIIRRAGGKVRLFAVRRLRLHRCRRMLTALTVASSSFIMPLPSLSPPGRKKSSRPGESPNLQNAIARNFASSWTLGTPPTRWVPSAPGMCRNTFSIIG